MESKNGTRNTLDDLNNHLFEQLERLNDEELTGESLEQEIMRAQAMTQLSTQIIGNAALALKAKQYQTSGLCISDKMPRMLEMKNG